MNDRLASLAAGVVEQKVASVERATMADFDKLLATDGFLISSPEYNASMSGVFKNTIDWVSRFRPQPLNGKQGFLMAASPSMTGGKIGLWALRQQKQWVEFLGELPDNETTRVELGETAAV